MKNVFCSIVILGMSTSSVMAEELTVITAGDQNMVDYINEYLGPLFESQNSGVTVRAVGTGAGDAGSQKILERFDAQAQANVEQWDADVAIIHEKFAGPMVERAHLEKFRDKIENGNLVTKANAKMALGTNVEGYVMPMFNSQTALAYNPALVPNPPKSYDELVTWAKENPKQFGYNGIKGGASGVSFVMGWIYAFAGDSEKLMNGPFEETQAEKWNDAFAKLKDFSTNATLTPGNAGTLDMLSRGEISIGPVWVDMFYSWMGKGQLPPEMKLVLPAPGMPGQPMHYVIPAKAPHKELAEKFVNLATSPEVQAKGIVERFNWYPGIDPQHVQAKLDEATWAKLFSDISTEELSKYGKSFPIAPYNTAILEAYERQVGN